MILGLILLAEGKIPYGIRGGPTLGVIQGRPAKVLSFVLIAIGVIVLLRDQVSRDVCLDRGGSWDQHSKACDYNE